MRRWSSLAVSLVCLAVVVLVVFGWLLALPDPADSQADPWAPVRECESRGDYTIVSPGGVHHGAYQFTLSTWDAVAGQVAPEWVGVLPSQAPAWVQDRMAQALAFEVPGGGLGHWPVCGALYGSGGGGGVNPGTELPPPASAPMTADPVLAEVSAAPAPTAVPSPSPSPLPTATATPEPVPSPTAAPAPTRSERVETVAALDVAPVGVEGATTGWSWESFFLGWGVGWMAVGVLGFVASRQP